MKRTFLYSFSIVLLLVTNNVFSSEPVLPIVKPIGLNEEKVQLGKRLFHEVSLSSDGTISCASCHNLDTGGVDRLPRSFGIDGQEGGINSPTVFNSALNFRQFWNGRALTLEDQINGPIESPKEMGNSWANVVLTLNTNDDYKKLFKNVYSDGVTRENVRNAIAEFERSLTLVDSRFDRYLRGDGSAISEKEEQGYKLFKDYGCVACHQGAGLGGNMFQVFGVMGNFFIDRGTPETLADLGRFVETKKTSDKYVFKVPSLRMVTLTAPYFHDGSVKTLKEAIKVMGKYQLGRELPEQDLVLIEAFLYTLAGPYKAD